MIIRKVTMLVASSVRKVLFIPIGVVQFILDIGSFYKKNRKTKESFSIPVKGIIPMIVDRYLPDGNIDRHYFLQDIYVAKKIIEDCPEQHYDIGSRVDGFIGHLLAGLQGAVKLLI